MRLSVAEAKQSCSCLLDSYFEELTTGMHPLPAEYRLKFALGTQLVLKLVKRNDLKGSRDSGGEQLMGALFWRQLPAAYLYEPGIFAFVMM